jgi:hypothetical protein
MTVNGAECEELGNLKNKGAAISDSLSSICKQ